METQDLYYESEVINYLSINGQDYNYRLEDTRGLCQADPGHPDCILHFDDDKLYVEVKCRSDIYETQVEWFDRHKDLEPVILERHRLDEFMELLKAGQLDIIREKFHIGVYPHFVPVYEEVILTEKDLRWREYLSEYYDRLNCEV